MIWSLLNLTASIPYIIYTIGLCARLKTAAKESHYKAVKRIFRYLVGTTYLGLWYKNGTHFNLVAYCDVDFPRNKMERKSTSSACQFLGEALNSWCYIKQKTIFTTNWCSHVLWIRNPLIDFSLRYTNIQIFHDNINLINLSKNSKTHSRSKHREIKHHFIRDHVYKKEIKLVFIDTNNQLADVFTKPLVEYRFIFINEKLKIIGNRI